MPRPRLHHLLFALALLPCAGQDPALRETFLQAKGLWSNQGDRDAAAAKFELLTAALQPKARELSAEWRQTLCETYNWLAVLDDRSPGHKARVAQDLESILELDPDFDIDRTITPARLQAQFDGLRNARLVKVQLVFEPDGGTLLLDGQPTPARPVKYLPLGPRKLVYKLPGYSTVERAIDAASGAVLPALEFKLRRTSASFKLYVNPAGAEVFLDGRSLGQTAGNAGSEMASVATEAGVKPEGLSSAFTFSDLSPGDHVIELRAPCHITRTIRLDKGMVSDFSEHRLVPYQLEPALGTLALTSQWAGGEVFLNGERRGVLPMAPLAVCAGTYTLEVRFPSGGFARTLSVEQGKTIALAVKPLPRLAYVGLDGGEEFTGKARLQEQLLTLGNRLGTVAFLSRTGPGTAMDTLGSLKAARESELFLRVEARREGSATLVELVLSTPENEEERLPVKPLEADPLGALVARLNRQPTLHIPWTGLSVIDLPGQPGAWVVQADEAAVKAGVQVHKPILQVDGKPVAGHAEFQEALRQAGGDQVKISQPAATATLAVVQASVELPVSDPALSYPYLLAELRLRLQGARGEAAGLLRFQQALALFHFRKYERAAELLREVRNTSAVGVGQGTIEYYTGLCLLRLGTAYVPEAIQAFTQALRYPGATLFGPEGPRVAPLARQAIEDHKLN